MAIQDQNRFSVQQGMMGQRANPQMQDPMQNMNRGGLPAGRAAQLQKWQDKSRSIAGNQPQPPPGKGPMQNLPGRMPMPQGQISQPQGGALQLQNLWRAGQGQAGGINPQMQGLQQLREFNQMDQMRGQGGFNPGQMDQMRPLAMEGRGIQPDARQLAQMQPQGPQGGFDLGQMHQMRQQPMDRRLQPDARQLAQMQPQGPQGGLGAVGGKS